MYGTKAVSHVEDETIVDVDACSAEIHTASMAQTPTARYATRSSLALKVLDLAIHLAIQDLTMQLFLLLRQYPPQHIQEGV